MELIPIKVESYSGYKADEYPKSFYWNNDGFEIEGIADRWYQGESNPEFPASNYFRVHTTSGYFIIKHELLNDNWYLCR